MDDKIKEIGELEGIIEYLKKSKKKIVTTNGSFDIVHYAHVNLLKKAKSLGDILIVLVNSDQSVKSNKGPLRPIISEKERAMMIAAIEFVDYVIIFNEEKPLNYLMRIKPHFHVKGGSLDPIRLREEIQLVKNWNGEYKVFELEDGFSTTKIIEEVVNRYVESRN